MRISEIPDFPSSVVTAEVIDTGKAKAIQREYDRLRNELRRAEHSGNREQLQAVANELGSKRASHLTLVLRARQAIELYKKYLNNAKELMGNKNHDYDEAWRKMRRSSLTDIILMKILRIKQIEDNQGKTIISEGLDANYYDIINYAMFALIKLYEGSHE